MQNVIGDVDPCKALSLSFRGQVFANNTFYGLKDKPTSAMNLVHLSRSPMEALFDRLVCTLVVLTESYLHLNNSLCLQIWVKDSMIYTDLFGARLLRQKEFPVTTSQIHLWLANPAAEDEKPLFDALKGRNTSQCMQYLKFLHDAA